MVKINVEKLIEFFDIKDDNNTSHATSIVSIAGEDLGAGLFKDYLKRIKKAQKIEIYNESPKKKGRSGPRLDRWIKVICKDESQVLYQTEIKNWSAHAIGGKNLELDANEEKIKEYCRSRWEDYYKHFDINDRRSEENVLNKVLIKMDVPDYISLGHPIVEPLLLLWTPLSNQDDLNCFGKMEIDENLLRKNSIFKDSHFKFVNIFSMSLYLRMHIKGKEEFIEFEMEQFSRRRDFLNNIFK